MSENQRRALTELMYRVILHARVNAWGCSRILARLSGKREAQIADMMDVIHNIPVFLNNPDNWDDDHFKTYFLDSYDNKWSDGSGTSLRKFYETLLDGKEDVTLFPFSRA